MFDVKGPNLNDKNYTVCVFACWVIKSKGNPPSSLEVLVERMERSNSQQMKLHLLETDIHPFSIALVLVRVTAVYHMVHIAAYSHSQTLHFVECCLILFLSG